jgi:hypothetical protein
VVQSIHLRGDDPWLSKPTFRIAQPWKQCLSVLGRNLATSKPGSSTREFFRSSSAPSPRKHWRGDTMPTPARLTGGDSSGFPVLPIANPNTESRTASFLSCVCTTTPDGSTDGGGLRAGDSEALRGPGTGTRGEAPAKFTFSPTGTIVLCMALTHEVLPKTSWLADRELQTLDWPAAGLPQVLHVDNAREFHSEALVRGCQEYGIRLDHRPTGQPHFGGTSIG